MGAIVGAIVGATYSGSETCSRVVIAKGTEDQ